MEKGSMEWEQMILKNELKQGRELTKQLKNHLNSSPETRQFLVEKILSSYEKALSMINGTVDLSPTSSSSLAACSPTSVGSGGLHCNKAQLSSSNRNVSKKRKALPSWSEQVRVCSQEEGPHDDGYSWRKYGQKDILGAIHPRGYYRCTYRTLQKCLATKQVQRSDEDPTIFEITYKGNHTCTKAIPKKISSSQQEPIQSTFPPSTPLMESQKLDQPIFSPVPNNVQVDFTNEMISCTTSATNSPLGEWDICLSPLEFESYFLDYFLD